MKPGTTFLACLILGFSANAENCKPPALSTAALELVNPLLEMRIRETAQQYSEDGRWQGESRYSADLEKLFYSLLENRSPVGDEAVAYFLFIDMGEYPDEEVACETINRGKRMLPIVRAYKQCRPVTGLEPLPKRVLGSAVLANHVIQSITDAKSCGNP